jgi:phosphoribosylglycinamide formyltransferase-1
MKNITILASGNGTNAENLFKYFKLIPDINIILLITNNPKAGALARAEKYKVPTRCIKSFGASNSTEILSILKEFKTDYIVLAGFLKLIPKQVIETYKDKIINIHPALLPKYGGKGMFGMHVHHAVIEAKERESGISVHFVNEQYDKGQIIAQYKCPVYADDTPENLAERIHRLEYKHFPKIVEKVVRGLA